MKTPEHKQDLGRVEIFPVPNIPWVKIGDNIGQLIFNATSKASISLQNKDVVVIAQKIVSRAEGRVVSFQNVIPSRKAIELSKVSGKDPRLCQLVLDESKQVLFANKRAVITEHTTGLVSGVSGIDTTNTGSDSDELAILLPVDPDESARKIRQEIIKNSNTNVSVIITDSIGRPFRKGSVGMAIGFAGIAALQIVDAQDLWGKKIHQEVALVDEIAAAASPVIGESNEGYPVAIVRGINYVIEETDGIKNLIRPPEEDQIWP